MAFIRMPFHGLQAYFMDVVVPRVHNQLMASLMMIDESDD